MPSAIRAEMLRGLKPAIDETFCGTTKVMPCYVWMVVGVSEDAITASKLAFCYVGMLVAHGSDDAAAKAGAFYRSQRTAKAVLCYGGASRKDRIRYD